MKKKPPKKKHTEAEYQELRAAATELASCVDFALRYLKQSAPGLVINLTALRAGGAPTLAGQWQDKFFDALERVGIRYDRAAYYRHHAKRRRA